MNALQVTVLFAMMVGVALSATCSGICKAPCNTANQACQFISNGNALCDTNFNICNTACDTLCACDDQCESQCQPDMDTCLADNAGNVIGLANCDVAFADCVQFCEGNCVVEQEQSIIASVIGGK